MNPLKRNESIIAERVDNLGNLISAETDPELKEKLIEEHKLQQDYLKEFRTSMKNLKPFYTHTDRPPKILFVEQNNDEEIVETAGHIPLFERVEALLEAGDKLEEYRKTHKRRL